MKLRSVLLATLLVLPLLPLTPAVADDELEGAAVVHLDSSAIAANGNVDVFIPTGSASSRCLATPGDSNGYGVGPSPVICVTRNFNGKDGIRLVMIPYFSPWPSTGLVLQITVWQRGAKYYGTPVVYTGP